jgi:hypothetical protein
MRGARARDDANADECDGDATTPRDDATRRANRAARGRRERRAREP